MILILSQKNNEFTTETVCDWLTSLGADFYRLNGADFVNDVVMKDGEFFFDHFDIEKINVVWYRRWLDDDFIKNLIEKANLDNINYKMLSSHLGIEINHLSKHFQHKLRNIEWVSRPEEINIYKSRQLDVAESVGLKIPSTIVTTRKKELKAFLKKNNGIITKSISNPANFYSIEDGVLSSSTMRTIEIKEEDLVDIGEVFFPTLFQELIPKSYELRVFYLDKCFYAMAIFSQLDEQTTIDFRNYNRDIPNRTVPFLLPVDLKKKLQSFVDYFNLTTGSFDLIYSTNNEFVFLEVNPVGQFGMTSVPTNYNLEKILAEFLIAKDEKRN